MFSKEEVQFFSNLDKAFQSNYLHVEICFDGSGSFAALRRLLLNSIFQTMNKYHICYLRIFSC